jgi:RNA polymerase sigma factor (sigma-70 family)
MSDLIQETVIRAREQFDKFDRETFTEFKYWARGILYMRHKHLMRQHRSRFDERTRRKIWLAVAFRKNLPNVERPELALEDKLEQREEAARAFAAFQRLKPHEQFIVNLRVVEGLPFAQIAALVNSTEGAVTKACGRALKRLRGLFESHETA